MSPLAASKIGVPGPAPRQERPRADAPEAGEFGRLLAASVGPAPAVGGGGSPAAAASGLMEEAAPATFVADLVPDLGSRPPGPRPARPGPAEPVLVGDGRELARALARAEPGQRIVLEDGTYRAPAGGFVLSADRVTIEAASPLGARLTSPLALRGSDQLASGLLFEGVGAEIAGDRSRLTASAIRDAGRVAVLISRGVDARVDHCELSGLRGRGVVVRPDPRAPEALLRPRIDHNWIHDSAVPAGGDGRSHEAIQVGQTLEHSDVSVGAVIEANLIEGVRNFHSVISLKSSDNVLRGNSLLDCQGGIVNRHGERNRIEANWLERAGGIWVRDEDTLVAGNRVAESRGAGLRVLAGNLPPGSRERGYPFASGTVLARNDVDRLVIGDNSTIPGNRLPAVGTRILGDQGAEPEVHLAEGTTLAARAPRGIRLATLLDRTEVGPGARALG